MNSYCSYLWRHLCIRPGPTHTPCCRFNGQSLAIENGVNVNDPLMQTIRSKMLNGESVNGCLKCDQEEINGTYSLRQIANSQYPRQDGIGTQIQNNEIRFLELYVGRNCNLKCLTCSPILSTTWESDYRALDWPIEKFAQTDVDYSQLIRDFENLDRIKFVGGEPLLCGDHDKCLFSISAERAKKIALVYFTNATCWPRPEILEKWKQFREVEICMSIDGVGAVNEYIRFPSKWPKVEAVANQYIVYAESQKNLKLNLHCTVSAYNVFSLATLEEWYRRTISVFPEHIFGYFTMNYLIDPDFMDIRNLTPQAKYEALRLLDPTSCEQLRVIQRIKSDAIGNVSNKLIEFTRKLDQVRGLNVLESIPQLSHIFDPKNLATASFSS